MKRRKTKRKGGTGAMKQAPGKIKASGLLIAAAIAVLVLLLAWPKLFPPKRAMPVSASQANQESSLAIAREVMGMPTAQDSPAPPDDADLSDADKATKCLNRGTDLLNAGKIEEAIAQYLGRPGSTRKTRTRISIWVWRSPGRGITKRRKNNISKR